MSTRHARAALLLALVAAFYLVFQFNVLRTVVPEWFEAFRESEAMVVSKMIDARTGGHSLLGTGTHAFRTPGWNERTYGAFEKGTTLEAPFQPYAPAFGLQGHAFNLMQSLTGSRNVVLYQSVNSLVLALLLALLVLWVLAEHGRIPAAVLALTVVGSPWLVSMARNLYWMEWTWFLPMFAAGAALLRPGPSERSRSVRLALAVFVAMLVKCLCGYEYVTTVVIAALVPVAYFGVKAGRPFARMARDALLVGAASIAAFAIAIVVHGRARSPDIWAGIQGIIWDAARRTHGGMDNLPPQAAESLRASPLGVVLRYLQDSFQPFVMFPYVQPMVLLGVMGIAACWLVRRQEPARRALGVAFAVAFVAPISWFLAAKGHSYEHLHVNFVLWSVPTVLVGSVCLAVWLRDARPAASPAGWLARLDSRFAIGALALVAVALRLLLASDRDILAINSPYDEHWYVASALRLIWGGEYFHMAFAHLPVYSAWIAFIQGFGVPGRLAIDLAWLAASGYLGFALRNLTGATWVGVAAFLVLAFHPYSFTVFDRALAETLLTVLSAFTLAGFVELWNTRDKGSWRRRGLALLAATVGFAAAYHTRKEGIVLLVPLAVLALVSLRQRPQWWSAIGRRRLAYPLLVYPFVSVLVVGALLAGANAWKWGMAVRHELAAPGYLRAIDALHAIDPGGPTPRHVTVTAKTRKLAYAASPTFAQLQPFFEGVSGQAIAKHTEQFTGVPGEIGNGWFYWALRDAGVSLGWFAKDSSTADARYAAIADELYRAFDAGKLPRRSVWLSMVDPDLGKWVGEVPGATLKELRVMVAPDQVHSSGPPENPTAQQFADFVRALGRRRLPQQTELAGWLKVPEGSAIGLGDAARSLRWIALSGPHRPDVPGAFPFAVTSPSGDASTHAHVLLKDGTMYAMPLEGLKPGGYFAIPGIAGAYIGVDRLAQSSPPHRMSPARTHSLAQMWTDIGYLLALAGMAGVALAWRSKQVGAIPAVALLAAVACFARAGVFGILDASSWSGLQARYLFPAVPAFVSFGVLGAWLLFRWRWGR